MSQFRTLVHYPDIDMAKSCPGTSEAQPVYGAVEALQETSAQSVAVCQSDPDRVLGGERWGWGRVAAGMDNQERQTGAGRIFTRVGTLGVSAGGEWFSAWHILTSARRSQAHFPGLARGGVPASVVRACSAFHPISSVGQHREQRGSDR